LRIANFKFRICDFILPSLNAPSDLVRRRILGVVAFAFLAAGAALWFWQPPDAIRQFETLCWRMGTLLGAWWLAWPDLSRLPRWLLLALPVLGLIVVLRPRVFLMPVFWVMAAALVAIAVLRPQRR
jgi:hypothetical protein